MSTLSNKRRELFLRTLAETGRVDVSARAAGFANTAPLYRMRRDDTTFAEDWEDAIKMAGDLLEAEAWRRAKEGVTKNVYYKGEVCGEEQVYSDGLMAKLLDGAKPEKYQKKTVDHTGEINVKGGIGVAVIPMRAANPADWEQEAAMAEARVIEGQCTPVLPPPPVLQEKIDPKKRASSTRVVVAT